MTTQDEIEKMLKKSEAIINAGHETRIKPKADYIIRVNAEGFHFSRSAFTDDELAKIRAFAMDLRNKRK